MGFNSFFYLLFFLPFSLAGYFVLNRIKKYILADMFLLSVSLWFVGYINVVYALMVCASIIINYLIGEALKKISEDRKRKLVLALGIAANVISLLYFKYYNFFIEDINAAFKTSLLTKEIILPLGISFYTFQQIAYLADTYSGRNKDVTCLGYALSVAYFPHIASGPIFLHRDVYDQFRDEKKRSLDYQNLSNGLYILAVGLFKKVIIADTFAGAVNWGFKNVDALSSVDIWLVSLCYTFQLYFDFSGYCDMAVGTSKMFNIEIPVNFNSPYKATSVIDFWGRWHLTLTQFLREYIYFPLGGSKKGKVRTYVNIMIIFLISGIWHGANWTFIVWGLLHGLFNCLNRMCRKVWDKINVVIRWFVTFVIVDLLWLIFRADSLSQAFYMIKKMFSMDSFSINADIITSVTMEEFRFLERYSLPSVFGIVTSALQFLNNSIYGFNMWVMLAFAFFVVLVLKNMNKVEFSGKLRRTLAVAVLLLWSMISFTGVATYIYAGF